MNADDYEIKPFPPLRRLTVDGGQLASKRHTIHALIEVDVTRPRRVIQAIRERTGERFSFTAFAVYCLAHAIEEHKHVQAYRTVRGRLVYFKEVDVNLMVEVETDGRHIPVPYFVRTANHKSARQIHDEIRAFQAGYKRSKEVKGLRLMIVLPGFARRLFYGAVFRNPFWLKPALGTVGLTAVGMFGKGSGWGIAFLFHNLDVTLGGIARKPGVCEDDRIEIREYLNVTLSFDHDVIDGAPAARFTERFRELLESGFGLDQAASTAAGK